MRKTSYVCDDPHPHNGSTWETEIFSTQLRQQLTKERAYCIWMENGCPQGRDLEFWNEAELQLGYKNHKSPEPIVLETLVATEEEKNKALERLMCADSQASLNN